MYSLEPLSHYDTDRKLSVDEVYAAPFLLKVQTTPIKPQYLPNYSACSSTVSLIPHIGKDFGYSKYLRHFANAMN